MSSQRKLAILMLALILDSQVYAADIFGGRVVDPHSRPYMVLLKMHMKSGKKHHCGGFLLNEDYVVTAAHCQAESYTVLLGLHNIRQSEEVQQIQVEKQFPHYNYQPDKLENDIMLLKLKSKAHFNDKVGPISLAGQNNGFLPKSCTVSGWGRSNRNSNFMSVMLMQVGVTLIDKKECAGRRLYCSEGEAGPGMGDSGGPLVCEDGKAYGVVAAGHESNHTDNIPAHYVYYYTKIPEYREWMDGIMEDRNDVMC